MHSARFELARVAPADLESAALDRSATNAIVISIRDHLLYKGQNQFRTIQPTLLHPKQYSNTK